MTAEMYILPHKFQYALKRGGKISNGQSTKAFIKYFGIVLQAVELFQTVISAISIFDWWAALFLKI